MIKIISLSCFGLFGSISASYAANCKVFAPNTQVRVSDQPSTIVVKFSDCINGVKGSYLWSEQLNGKTAFKSVDSNNKIPLPDFGTHSIRYKSGGSNNSITNPSGYPTGSYSDYINFEMHMPGLNQFDYAKSPAGEYKTSVNIFVNE